MMESMEKIRIFHKFHDIPTSVESFQPEVEGFPQMV